MNSAIAMKVGFNGLKLVLGEVSEDEMLRTFNCGLGMVLIVGCRDADEIIQQLPPDYAARVVGCVKPRLEGRSYL